MRARERGHEKETWLSDADRVGQNMTPPYCGDLPDDLKHTKQHYHHIVFKYYYNNEVEQISANFTLVSPFFKQSKIAFTLYYNKF